MQEGRTTFAAWEQDLDRFLIAPEDIQARVQELGQAITNHYANVDELTLVAVINGALPFTADLMRAIQRPVRLDCIRVSSYQDQMRPATKPQILDRIHLDLRDRHVLIIDDILDTGNTMKRVMRELQHEKPASLALCVLLEKEDRLEVDLKPDFVGFRIPDEFVVGYGLDFAERYRNLPGIGVLKAECQNPPEWN
ncbi:MAG: hypoxanthine phosphoribosyltransferase [Verrucomicrobiota bacterium JB022]|nr:hypoxanthine phosphoribosyltransferase [Verrucomicrobiota bacterium JB022]